MPKFERGLAARRSFCALLQWSTALLLLGAAPVRTHADHVPEAGSARLVSSSASGVSFEIDVPEPRFTQVKTANATYQRFDLGGY